MARLAAIAKALYYPTSEDVTARILRTVTVRAPGGRILDVCAGEGHAVATLASAWGLQAYGVELDAVRAQVARARMHQCLRGSYNQLHASKGSFHALFCNPPYDVGQDGAGNSVRLEVLFLQAATDYLANDGLLVLVIPRAILHNEKFKSLMRSRYFAARAFDYPLPERNLFDQVVVLARRQQHGYAREIATDDLTVIGDDTYILGGKPVSVERASDLTSFYLAGRNPYAIAPSWQSDAPSGVYATSTWDALVGHAGNKVDRPLMPPRPGHQAMLLAAGALNGAEIRGRYLIKGSSEKVVDTVVEEGDKKEGDEGAIVERERVVSRLAVLDLHTGEFDAWRVNDHQEKTAAWFQDYGADLAQAVRQLHTPEFDGNLAPSEARLARLHAPGILPGHTTPEILRIQKEVAAAVSFHWRGSKERKPRKTALLAGEMGTGKAQPLSAKILTPTGWRDMGSLRVGDIIIDPEGGTTTIEGVFPQGIKPVYRVTFCDGTSTVCCDDHLWLVNTPLRKWRDQPARVLSLREIRGRLHHANGNRQHFIPLVAPVEFAETQVPLDPYLLGVLLGDGGLTKSVRLSTGDEQILRLIEPMLPSGVSIVPVKGSLYDYDLFVKRGQRNPVSQALRGLDLFGRRSEHKFVPPSYLHNSVEVRTAILQGLLDTDGGVANDRGTGIEYTSVSEQLARHVRELVQSLGGVATLAPKETTYTHKGQKHQGQTAYCLYITLPPDIRPFRLARKLAAYSPGTKYGPSRSIEKVEYVGGEACQCIKVSSPNSLYVTDDYIVTHNTSMATVAVELYGAPRTVIVCPAHLVRKWIREVETITGQKGVAVAGKKLSDVDRFFVGAGKRPARYLVLSKEIAKLGTRWEPAFVMRTLTQVREVVDNEAMDALPYWNRRVITKQVREVVRLVACPQCGRSTGYTHRGFDRDNHQYCVGCRSPLWTSTALNDKGSTRWPLAEYIGQRYARRYVLVIDEGHQYAGAESDQSRAIQDLAAGAHKILAMTGTLYGGRASSLFYLLYKVEPSFRERYGFKDCARFSQHFGLFETRYDLKASTSRYGTRRGGKRSGGRTKEIPGMSPAMIPLLLPYTIFVKLKDLRQELPPYAEDVRIIDHDPAVLKAIFALSKEVRKVLRSYPKVLGQYLQTCLGYPDCPEQAEEVWAIDEQAGLRKFIASAPAFPRVPQPKDEEVVRIVREEKHAGRQVLVFFAQTHKRDARGRVRAALEAEGFRVEVLDASVQPDKREEWLEKACARGFDVLLTNGRLVETGLDLLFAKTIIQYGTEYSVPVLRQSVRRSWRLGQIDPIRVVFLAYRATMQEVAMNLIARKMRAAEMVDGDETGGLADYDSSGANFFVELAQEAVASALADEAKAA